jgi:hypothetical protein
MRDIDVIGAGYRVWDIGYLGLQTVQGTEYGSDMGGNSNLHECKFETAAIQILAAIQKYI